MYQLKNLTKSFKDTKIFENANYTFNQSGLTAVIGASGSGKSTLLNMIAGFDSNYTGEILVENNLISSKSSNELADYRKNTIGFIFQEYNLLKGYTVLESVVMGVSFNDSDREFYQNQARDILNKIGLESKINEKIENLSGGQKQRVAIARALVKNPKIILADEPTGALDRKNSTEIMELLKEISKDRLVVVITHDQKLTSFFDTVITVDKGQIVEVKNEFSKNTETAIKKEEEKTAKNKVSKLSKKNFKIHLKRYIAVALAIAIGVTIFISSLSFSSVMANSIEEFKEKNIAFNNGYIKDYSDEIYSKLENDNRIENVYRQYKLKDLTLIFNGKKEKMQEKIPMPKANESMSYGTMPRNNANEIALTPSLAKKFDSNINELIGKKITLEFMGKSYDFTVSGIFNAGYDDFFISSHIEIQLYENITGSPYSISFDVVDFNDVDVVYNELQQSKINATMANETVTALKTNFNSINKLFTVISVLILFVAIFLAVILLVKLQNSRVREVGLLSALGYYRSEIRNMLLLENSMLTAMTLLFSVGLIMAVKIVTRVVGTAFVVSATEIALGLVATVVIILAISTLASVKLIKLQPAEALRK